MIPVPPPTKPKKRLSALPSRVIRRIPGLPWLLGWRDPLHIARRSLRQAMVARADFVRGRLLDVGCGGQPYRREFRQVTEYVAMDLPRQQGVTVYGSALALPFADAVFDTVLCNQVLEHVPEPMRLVSESARVLKPGGVLLLTTPQTWGLHHEPHDYFRFTKYGLRHLAEQCGFTVIEVTPTTGLWATWAQRLADTMVYTYLAKRGRLVKALAGLALAPLLLAGYSLDKVFGFRGDTLDNVLLARKPETAPREEPTP